MLYQPIIRTPKVWLTQPVVGWLYIPTHRFDLYSTLWSRTAISWASSSTYNNTWAAGGLVNKHVFLVLQCHSPIFSNLVFIWNHSVNYAIFVNRQQFVWVINIVWFINICNKLLQLTRHNNQSQLSLWLIICLKSNSSIILF